MAVSCLHKFVPLSEYSTLDNKAFQFFRLCPGVCIFKLCNTEGRYAGLIHVETFSETLCATALRNKFQQALRRETWSVSSNFFELPLGEKFHEK